MGNGLGWIVFCFECKIDIEHVLFFILVVLNLNYFLRSFLTDICLGIDDDDDGDSKA